MYDWHDGGWGVGTWVTMVLVMVAFWGLLAVLVVYLVRGTSGRHESSTTTEPGSPASALNILDERFARGEIDAEEYQQRRDLLRRT